MNYGQPAPGTSIRGEPWPWDGVICELPGMDMDALPGDRWGIGTNGKPCVDGAQVPPNEHGYFSCGVVQQYIKAGTPIFFDAKTGKAWRHRWYDANGHRT